MPQFKLPLSGDVTQTINPWTAWFSPFNNQFGVVNIHLGRSSNPAVEEEILEEVGSYGRQLGRIGEALGVLIQHFKPEKPLSRREAKAIEDLKEMLSDIEAIKTRQKA